MLKVIIPFLFVSQVYAMDTYPLKFGMGAESCHPNSDGFTYKPENLSRLSIIATPIGSENDFSTVILGIDHL